MTRAFELLRTRIEACDACPRLVRHRQHVAKTKRRAYVNDTYHGKPVAGFGDERAHIVIVGLAPGAHGANRTGRVFTGDASGDFLYAALHREGLASQAKSVGEKDGLQLHDLYVTLAARCVPPDNRPAPLELRRCEHWLDEELDLLANKRVLLALGGIAWDAALGHASRRGTRLPKPKPKFAHGAELVLGSLTVVASYHVSQQNTLTGRLTPVMFDRVVRRVKKIIGSG